MSGPGVSGTKPIKDYQKLGADVSVEVSAMEHDGWASNLLMEIGKTVGKAEGRTYLGSAALHIYVTSKFNLAGQQTIEFINQMELQEVSETAAQVAVSEFTKAVMRYYGVAPKTLDPNYKVNE